MPVPDLINQCFNEIKICNLSTQLTFLIEEVRMFSIQFLCYDIRVTKFSLIRIQPENLGRFEEEAQKREREGRAYGIIGNLAVFNWNLIREFEQKAGAKGVAACRAI